MEYWRNWWHIKMQVKQSFNSERGEVVSGLNLRDVINGWPFTWSMMTLVEIWKSVLLGSSLTLIRASSQTFRKKTITLRIKLYKLGSKYCTSPVFKVSKQGMVQNLNAIWIPDWKYQQLFKTKPKRLIFRCLGLYENQTIWNMTF